LKLKTNNHVCGTTDLLSKTRSVVVAEVVDVVLGEGVVVITALKIRLKVS